MSKFTVIGFNEATGETHCMKVEAESVMHSMYVSANENPSISIVCAMEGDVVEGASFAFAGEGVVDAATILSQPEVFAVTDD